MNIAIPHEGATFRYAATYYDVVPEESIMYNNKQRILVSLATIEFAEAYSKQLLDSEKTASF